MIASLESLSELPDSAEVRIYPVEGGLPAGRRESLLAVLRELMAQWRATGAIRAGGAEVLAGGAFVIVAWEAAGDGISGCTRDGLTHVVLAFEKQLGRRIANAPRMAVRLDGEVRLMTPGDFKRLRAEGRIGEETVVYDHLVATLGDVRAGRFETTVGKSWYGRIGG